MLLPRKCFPVLKNKYNAPSLVTKLRKAFSVMFSKTLSSIYVHVTWQQCFLSTQLVVEHPYPRGFHFPPAFSFS